MINTGKQEENKEEKPIEYVEKEGKKFRVILEEDDEYSAINKFKASFESGIKGENILISTGFPKLDQYISIRRKVYYLIGAYSGVGKTTFTDEAFVFNPIEWYLSIKDRTKIDFKIIYWSMERSLDEKIARWISRKIFLDKQIIISPDEILSRKYNSNLSREQEKIVREYIPYMENIFKEVLTIHEGATNPNDINARLKEFSGKRGKKEIVVVRKTNGYEYFKSVYIPDNPNEFILVIVDPVNRIRTESNKKEGRALNKKESIEKVSEHLLDARDNYGYSVVVTSQFNRSITNPLRMASTKGVQPMAEDFKETGSLYEDAQVVLSVFDPSYFKVDDICGYNLSKLKEGKEDKIPGSNKYRQLCIIKNSYGASNIALGLGFQPQCGIFKQLPYPDQMTEEIYRQIISDEYFF